MNHPTNIKRTERSLLPPLMIRNETLDRRRRNQQRQIGDKVTQANFGENSVIKATVHHHEKYLPGKHKTNTVKQKGMDNKKEKRESNT
jgi:hypothetical protein